jgi:hypothetical protein
LLPRSVRRSIRQLLASYTWGSCGRFSLRAVETVWVALVLFVDRLCVLLVLKVPTII